MNGSRRGFIEYSLCLLVILLAFGCSSRDKPDGKITGKLLNKGVAYKAQLPGGRLPPGEEGLAQIIFYPITSDNQSIIVGDDEPIPGGVAASIREDGTFEMIVGKKGLNPGKHRVVIKHINPHTDSDMLKGKFNERNSKINREIKIGDEIVIDLNAPGK